MALGNKNQRGDMIILKPVLKGEDGQKPHFTVKRKVDGKWEADEEGVNKVTGDLVGLKIKESEYKGEKYNEVLVFLEDKSEEETYMLNLRFNLATRSLFNAIVSLEDNFQNLSVSLYADKENGYPRFGIFQGEDMVRWKHELDSLPKPEETEFQGKVLRDFSELDKFFGEELEELRSRIQKSPSSSSDGSSSEDTGQEEEDDDVPF